MGKGETRSIVQAGNKRRDKRFSSHAPVTFSVLGTKFGREFASMTFNHSKSGLCLETAEEVKPGTVLFIRRGRHPVDEQHDVNWKHLRHASLGEVRWCRELEDKFGAYYCLGVRYY